MIPLPLLGAVSLTLLAGLTVPKIWLFVYISVTSGMVLNFLLVVFVSVEAPSCKQLISNFLLFSLLHCLAACIAEHVLLHAWHRLKLVFPVHLNALLY